MYEILDKIADSYTPLLLIFFIYFSVIRLRSGKYGIVKNSVLFLFLSLIVGYGFMFLDNYLELYKKLNLDYSTHTVVALSGVLAIGFITDKWIVPIFTLICYCGLMLYQQYHTVADILSTFF